MNNQTKKLPTRLRHIPPWIFLILFVASTSVCVYSLRQNNETMIKLRNAVYVADKNNGDVSTALNNLRRYVYGHMNTNLSSGGNAIKPPIQLKYTYARLQAAAQSQANSTNSQLYTQAEYYCQQLDPTDFSGRNRVPCVQNYVTTHGVSASSIPVALYEFDFISPTWSPDLAGWSLILSVLMFVISIASFTADRLIKVKLRPL